MKSKFISIFNYKNRELNVRAPYNKDIIAEYKKLDGKWNKDTKEWIFKFDKKDDISNILNKYFGENGFSETDYVDVYLTGNAVNNGNFKDLNSHSFTFQGRILICKKDDIFDEKSDQIILDDNVEIIQGDYANCYKEFPVNKFFNIIPLCGKNIKLKVKNVPLAYIQNNKFNDITIEIIK